MLENRSFTEVCKEVDKGRLLERLTEQLAEVVRSVKETGKIGELGLKLKIRSNGEAISVEAVTAVKVPDVGIRTSLFFADDDGNLTRNDPKQAELDLRPQPRLVSEGV